MRIERILVGLDGSADARRATEFAASLAVALGAEVVGVHAMGLLEAFGDDDGAGKHLATSRDHVRTELNGAWSEPLRSAQARHRLEIRDGNPVHVLLSAAAELGAQLVVVGSKGTGDLAEQLMGSTSTQIAERSAVPVVVVPGPHAGRSTDSWERQTSG